MFLASCFFLACTDYALHTEKNDEADTEAEDSGPPVVDTAVEDTGTTDTGGSDIPDDTGVPATESIYINTADELFSFDPATGIATRIGTFREGGSTIAGGMTDIAISLDGIMYGVSFAALYKIDPTTADCTYVASVDDSLTGLAFVSDGRLLGAGSAVSVVDTRTGRLTTIVPTGEYQTSGDIIGLPDGFLYWTVTGGDDLVRVDPTTGDTRRQGSVGQYGIYGLGYANGELYGFASGNTMLVIDPATGRGSSDQTLRGSWWGAATNPVLW
jgi:hypothetical protein